MFAAEELRVTCESKGAWEGHRRKELGQQPRLETGETQIGVAIGNGISHRRLDLSGDVRVGECYIHVAHEIDALVAGPVESKIELARSLTREANPGPLQVGGIQWIAVQPQMQIAVVQIVFAVTGSLGLREGDARAFPPQ